MDRDELRALDRLLVGNDYDDETLDGILPVVQQHLDGLDALRALPLADVANGLVAAAGGRKR